ncbi:LuxR C-terminal-related transcriptional regulator [Candidatus Finniella inopinata]|uniref:HTH luxR-type domain-containing protein n=1 Tax=Candidatus Finniella inopinata TaxID=1696036 RepID=A0A4Q7DFX0_9PROT|nr:LuxR C-terminal-related transcriptional regulator [Candidatus Finniella inopinata]RZI45721.1 hypothetical protein EQU50_06370 [Candidatus Finniella inopinata]
MSFNGENSISVAYNESVQLTLLDICAPLFQTFGLMTFGYKRIFKDGSYLFLSTNTQWQSHHLYEIHNHGQFFKNAMLECADTPEFAFYRTMWPSSPSDHFLQSLNQYGMWNGINFYRKKDDSIELWTFSTNPEQHQDPNSYIKILNHLERFIAFFNVKACNIIDVSDKKKLAKFKDGLDLVLIDEAGVTSINTEFFLDATKINNIPILVGSQFVQLSKRETECLRLIAYGKSAKEAAHILKISPRTVEGLLVNAKLKAGALNMSQMTSSFHQSCSLMGIK